MSFGLTSRAARVLLLSTIAMGTGGLNVSAAAAEIAKPKDDNATAKHFFAKRSNGSRNNRSRQADTPAETATNRSNGRGRNNTSTQSDATVETATNRSNGRGRNNGQNNSVTTPDIVTPIPLDFARETTNGGNSGSIAAEVPSFNIADTTAEALETASTDTRPAQLAAYQAARIALFEAAAQQDAAYQIYLNLVNLDETSIAAQFPNSGYDAAVTQAHTTYIASRDNMAEKQEVTRALLMEISDGTPLSDGAVQELNGLLGV